MSSINKILNDALANGIFMEAAQPGQTPQGVNEKGSIAPDEAPRKNYSNDGYDAIDDETKRAHEAHPAPYAAAAAIGAGIGAVQVAKKLREKKAEAVATKN